MDHQIIHIHPDAPPKPDLGTPCNGCGVCCLTEPCPLGMLLSRRRTGACAALRWEAVQARYVCGAITDAARVWGVPWLPPFLARWLAWWARRWVAAGKGCDASLDVQRPPEP